MDEEEMYKRAISIADIFGWLGFWRDNIDPEIVKNLQDKLKQQSYPAKENVELEIQLKEAEARNKTIAQAHKSANEVMHEYVDRAKEAEAQNKKLMEITIEKILSESEMVIDDDNGDYFKFKKSTIRELLKEGG